MPFNLSTGEILVLLLVAVVVFGGRLPEVAKRIGKTIHEFKGGMREEIRRLDRDVDEQPPADWTPPPDGAECEGFGPAAVPEETAAPEETEAPAETAPPEKPQGKEPPPKGPRAPADRSQLPADG